MDKLRNGILWLVLIGVVLDLTISGGLIYASAQLSQNTQAARCWDRVLDQALVVHPTAAEHAHLLVEANKCARLIP